MKESDRRAFLRAAAALGGATVAARVAGQGAVAELGVDATTPPVGRAAYKRIATEEAWGTIEIFRAWKRLLESNPADEPGFVALWRNLDPAGNTGFTPRLTDLGAGRLAAMDAALGM